MGISETRANCRACGKEFVQRSSSNNGRTATYCAECYAALVGRNGGRGTNNQRADGNKGKRRKRKRRRGGKKSQGSGTSSARQPGSVKAGKLKKRADQKNGTQPRFWQVVCCVCKRAFFTDKQPPRRELVQCPQCMRRRVERFRKLQQGG